MKCISSDLIFKANRRDTCARKHIRWVLAPSPRPAALRHGNAPIHGTTHLYRPPRHLFAEPGGDLGGGPVRGGAPLSAEPAARSGGAPAAAGGLPSSFGRLAPGGESSPSSRAEGERRSAGGAAEAAAEDEAADDEAAGAPLVLAPLVLAPAPAPRNAARDGSPCNGDGYAAGSGVPGCAVC